MKKNNLEINFFGENVTTFYATDTVKNGDLVKFTENFTVAPCESNDEIAGRCVRAEDGFAAVQLSGYIEIESNKKIALGISSIVAASATQATTSTTARKYNVVYSTDSKVGFIL